MVGIRLHVTERYEASVEQAAVLFLALEGREVPFFVESWLSDAPLVVKFEDVNSREEAVKISNRELFLRGQDIRSEGTEATPDFMLLNGYIIVDEVAGAVGAIHEILEMPQQIMAVVLREEKELLIPLNDAYVLEIDQQQQRILMALPEGLLELYR